MEIVIPILTPFKGDKIDQNAMAEHAGRLTKEGADIIFVAGSTGLGVALSTQEKMLALEAVYSSTKKVIFQVGGLNLYDIKELLSYSKKFDIIGVAAIAPYYFQRIPEGDLVRYYKDICSSSPHDVYVYNYPLATGKDIIPKVIREAGCIKGLKDTTSELFHSLQYKRDIQGIKVYTGTDTLILSAFTSGLDGVVAGSGNYALDIIVKIRESVKRNDIKEGLKLQFKLSRLIDLARQYGQFSANYELAKVLRGYDVGEPRAPIYPLSDEEKNELRIKSLEIYRD
ncbi:2-dehydro-3-deoxy-phosphogluconate aldolase [Sulfolobales archaeon HS-7]|nr:2-dehydro-3-deoxy-phosphogluconate aldolase [Sulfolobales archaeon HS-7]